MYLHISEVVRLNDIDEVNKRLKKGWALLQVIPTENEKTDFILGFNRYWSEDTDLSPKT